MDAANQPVAFARVAATPDGLSARGLEVVTTDLIARGSPIGSLGTSPALDAAAEDGPPGSEPKPEPWKLQQELNDIGRNFRRIENVIADREAIKAKEQKVAKAAKPNGDSRKRAEAAAGQAQSDGKPPLT